MNSFTSVLLGGHRPARSGNMNSAVRASARCASVCELTSFGEVGAVAMAHNELVLLTVSCAQITSVVSPGDLAKMKSVYGANVVDKDATRYNVDCLETRLSCQS